MNPVSALTVFIVIWWLVFLMALPFGSSPPEKIESGHADSAPDNPLLMKKLIFTTLVSLVLFLITFLAIKYTGFTFRE